MAQVDTSGHTYCTLTHTRTKPHSCLSISLTVPLSAPQCVCLPVCLCRVVSLPVSLRRSLSVCPFLSVCLFRVRCLCLSLPVAASLSPPCTQAATPARLQNRPSNIEEPEFLERLDSETGSCPEHGFARQTALCYVCPAPQHCCSPEALKQCEDRSRQAVEVRVNNLLEDLVFFDQLMVSHDFDAWH